MNEQQKFFDILNDVPFAATYWSVKNDSAEVDIQRLEKAMRTGSAGERIMLSFLANVWLGTEKYKFSITGAASVLDTKYQLIIIGWLAAPFWP